MCHCAVAQGPLCLSRRAPGHGDWVVEKVSPLTPHSDWTKHCYNYTALRQTTSTGFGWNRTRWPEWYVKPRLQPVLPSYIISSTGCQFANGSPVIAVISYKTRSTGILAYLSPHSGLSSTTDGQTTDCYSQYRAWR